LAFFTDEGLGACYPGGVPDFVQTGTSLSLSWRYSRSLALSRRFELTGALSGVCYKRDINGRLRRRGWD